MYIPLVAVLAMHQYDIEKQAREQALALYPAEAKLEIRTAFEAGYVEGVRNTEFPHTKPGFKPMPNYEAHTIPNPLA